MGGKSYFCDYCRCYMKNDKHVRKTHNHGIQHTTIKKYFMQKFRDPPKFDDTGFQYFHFNETQLNILEEACKNSNTKYISNLSNTSKYKATKECFELPWQTSITKGNLKLLQKLPPSLQPLKLKRLSKMDLRINKWS